MLWKFLKKKKPEEKIDASTYVVVDSSLYNIQIKNIKNVVIKIIKNE